MADPILDELGNINEDDILEFVHGDVSPRRDSFSVTRADLEMVYKVPGDKLVAFLMWMLGVDYVSVVDNGGTFEYKLNRTCPAFHPVHNWAWCSAVQVQGQGFRGDADDIVRWEFQNTPAKWAQYTCTATYDMPKYNIFYDGTVSTEYERFVSKEFFSNVELVSVENGQLVYDAPGKNFDQKPATSPITQTVFARRETAGIKLKWNRVPLYWVQEDDDKLPTKLLQMQGRVNDATFLGQPAETLLCKNVTMEKYVSPLVTNTFGSLYFLYDITFELIWYDPLPKGKAGENRNGWNFFIATDYQYYYAKNKGNNKVVFQDFTFDKAFTHYSDTWTP